MIYRATQFTGVLRIMGGLLCSTTDAVRAGAYLGVQDLCPWCLC